MSNILLVAVFVALASSWGTFVCGAAAPSLTPLVPFEKSSGNTTAYIIVSPDGRHVYAVNSEVSTSFNNVISQFSRDEITGELSPLNPFTVPFAYEVATSGVFDSSGEFLYLAPWASNVTIYSRNTATGQLTHVGDAPVNSSVNLWTGLALSSDETTLYHSANLLLTVYSRKTDGTLNTVQQVPVPQSLADPALSPDGRFLYVAAFAASNNPAQTVVYQFEVLSNKTVVLSNTFPGDNATISLAFSPDGKNLYLTRSGLYGYDTSGLLEYSVNPTTGALTLTNEYPACDETLKVVVSPEGQSVYVTCSGDDSIAQYFRDTDTGALTQLTPFLVDAGADPFMGLEFSPDGRFLYVANSDSSGTGAGTIAGYSRFVPLSLSPSPSITPSISPSPSNDPSTVLVSPSIQPPGTTGTTTGTTGRRTTGRKRRSTTGTSGTTATPGTTGVSDAWKSTGASLTTLLVTLIALVLF